MFVNNILDSCLSIFVHSHFACVIYDSLLSNKLNRFRTQIIQTWNFTLLFFFHIKDVKAYLLRNISIISRPWKSQGCSTNTSVNYSLPNSVILFLYHVCGAAQTVWDRADSHNTLCSTGLRHVKPKRSSLQKGNICF